MAEKMPFGDCPSCNKPLTILVKKNGEVTSITHEHPICDVFEEHTGDTFVKYVYYIREAMNRPTIEE
jgi:hypothetical protein